MPLLPHPFWPVSNSTPLATPFAHICRSHIIITTVMMVVGISFQYPFIGFPYEVPVDVWTLKLVPAVNEPEPNENRKQPYSNHADVVHRRYANGHRWRHTHEDSQEHGPKNRETIANVAKDAKIEISRWQESLSALNQQNSLGNGVCNVQK